MEGGWDAIRTRAGRGARYAALRVVSAWEWLGGSVAGGGQRGRHARGKAE